MRINCLLGLTMLLGGCISGEAEKKQQQYIQAHGNCFYKVTLSPYGKEKLSCPFRYGYSFDGGLSLLSSDLIVYSVKEEGKIFAYDPLLQKSKFLRNGFAALAVGERRFVFYGKTTDENHGLMAVSIGSISNEVIVDRATDVEDRSSYTRVDDDSFVYYNSAYKSVWKYQFSTGRHTKTKVSDCMPRRIWRAITNQVLCAEMDDEQRYSGKYFLSDLGGKKIEYINFESLIVPMLYRSDNDTLLYGVSRYTSKGQVYDLWSYNFSNNNKKRVRENFGATDMGLIPLFEN